MRDAKSIAIVSLGLSCAFLAGAAIFRPGPAEAQQAASANDRFVAATGSVGSGMSVLWLVDTEGKRVLVYGTNNMGKNVEFRAARNIEWDLRLDWFNDESQYTVEDMRRLAEKQRQPAAPPPKEVPGGAAQPGGK